jgi:DNA repair protein SbcC/Rad50
MGKSTKTFIKLDTKLSARIESMLKSDKTALTVFDALKNGQNTYVRMERTEDSAVDLSWINIINDTIPAIGKIVQNPRITTKTVDYVVPIELSKKINSESVRHLSSHSQFVKEINEDGTVIPKKILNQLTEDNIKTYENRLVATLIKHLFIFLRKRYEYIMKYSPLCDFETLYVKNVTTIDGSLVEIETKIKFARDTDDRDGANLKSYAAKVEEMMHYLSGYTHSDFMTQFKNERDVRLPVLQTNILRKNPDYRKCLRLFSYIESYSKLGINITVNEKYKEITPEDQRDINKMVFANFLTLKGKSNEKDIKVSKKTYKPKIQTNLDDIIFCFKDFASSPDYVRVDKEYFDEINQLVPKDLKSKPNKEDIAHRKAEYEEKQRQIKLQKAAKNLEKRKEAEAKLVLQKIEAQEKAEALRKKKAELALARKQQKLEDERLKRVRGDIIDVATIDKAKDPKREPDKVVEPDVVEKKPQPIDLITVHEAEQINVSTAKKPTNKEKLKSRIDTNLVLDKNDEVK